MGYFSNGTEGEIYEEQYCFRCVHRDEDNGCPVWTLHLLHNYDEADKPDSFLHILIPLSQDGHNDQCAMFIEAAQTPQKPS